MAPHAAGGSRFLLALGGVVWLVWPGNELHLRTPARWRHRRTGRRQPELRKNGLDRATFFPPSTYPPTATTCACWIIRLPHFGDQRRRSTGRDPPEKASWGNLRGSALRSRWCGSD